MKRLRIEFRVSLAYGMIAPVLAGFAVILPWSAHTLMSEFSWPSVGTVLSVWTAGFVVAYLLGAVPAIIGVGFFCLWERFRPAVGGTLHRGVVCGALGALTAAFCLVSAADATRSPEIATELFVYGYAGAVAGGGTALLRDRGVLERLRH